jgi:TPR repeat protein
MFNLGELLLLQDLDSATARHWWEQAARAGHTKAMFEPSRV